MPDALAFSPYRGILEMMIKVHLSSWAFSGAFLGFFLSESRLEF